MVKWKARDGFLCVLAVVVMSFVTNQVLWFLYRHNSASADWMNRHAYFTEGALMVVQGCLTFLTVLFFARSRSTHEFLAQVGLGSGFTILGWLAAWAGVGIGFLALYGTLKQWIPPDQTANDFYREGGWPKIFFIAYGVLLGPFFEEVFRRGFLYRAFRTSFNPVVSTIFVLGVHAYFHWGIISQAFYTFACLMLVEVLLCILREWTGNVWNCVLCHAAFNATQGLPKHVYIIALMLLLAYYVLRELWARRRSRQGVTTA